MRRFLDRLYLAGGYLAAICLVGILVVIVLQMAARWLLITFPGSSEYAGYLMAASSFFAFAYAMNASAHIRVTLFIKALGKYRYWGEIWCFAIGAIATTYIAWYAIDMVYWSIKFGDISQGRDATPIWIVQLPVVVGSVLFAICFWDNLLSLLFKKKHNVIVQSLSDQGE